MAQAGHTPGPWRVARATDYAGSELNVDAGTRGYVCLAGLRGDSEAEANARLIAAAPTMHGYIARRAAEGDSEAAAILEAINAVR